MDDKWIVDLVSFECQFVYAIVHITYSFIMSAWPDDKLILYVKWDDAAHDNKAAQLRPSDPLTLVLALVQMEETYIYIARDEITCWRHDMDTLSKLFAFSVSYPPVTGQYSQRTRGFCISFVINVNTL